MSNATTRVSPSAHGPTPCAPTNPPPDGSVDAVTRWARQSPARGGAGRWTLFARIGCRRWLALGQPGLDWRWLTLAIIGILLAPHRQ